MFLSAVRTPEFTPIMEIPEFAALSGEVSALRCDADAIKAEILRLEQRAAELPDANSTDEIDRIARAELDGEPEEETESLEQIVARVATLRTRHAIARRKLDLKRAELQTLKSEYSVDAVNIYRPRHQAAVAKVLAAWAALREAIGQERQCRVEFAEAGYDSRLPEHGPRLPFNDPGMTTLGWEEDAKAYAR